MKTIEIKLFSFDELPADVQQRVIEREREPISEWLNEITCDDFRATLEKFEAVTNTECSIACGGAFSCRFSDGGLLSVDSWELAPEEINGKLLWRWLNNFMDDNRERKNLAYKNGRSIRSKIFAENIDDGWWTLTGVYSDRAIIAPIVDAYTHPQKVFGNPNYNLRTLINECYEAFSKDWERCLYNNYANDDVIAEELRCNSKYYDEVFTEEGTLYAA